MIASSTNQARHKPAPKKRSTTKDTKEDKERILIIDSEPAESGDGDDWYYFWYKIPGQSKNAKGNGKTINCRKHQVSWVKEAYESNTLLVKGKHFEGRQIATPGGPSSHRYRYVLKDDWFIPEPVGDEDDPPMAWAEWDESGNEIPVLGHESSDEDHDPAPITDPVAIHTLKRYDSLCLCWDAAGVTPSEEQRAEAIRTLNAGVLIECKQRR